MKQETVVIQESLNLMNAVRDDALEVRLELVK